MTLEQAYGLLAEGYEHVLVPEVAYVRQGNKVWFATGGRELTESVNPNTDVVVESVDELEIVERDGQKHIKDGHWVVEGPFQRSDVENANKRVYSRKIWERIFGNPKSRQQETIKARGMIGHLEHPKDGRTDGKEGALVVTEGKLKPDGVVWGKAELLDTPNGRILQEYTRKHVRWGVSSRGNGSVDSSGKVNESDYDLETFDAVMRPSTPGAYPTQVRPGVPSTREDMNEMEEKGVTEAWDADGIKGLASSGYATGSHDHFRVSVKKKVGGKVGVTLHVLGEKKPEFVGTPEEAAAHVNKHLAAVKDKKAPTYHVESDTVSHEAAQECVEDAEAMIADSTNKLDESAATKLIADLLKRYGQVSKVEAVGSLAKEKAKTLRKGLATRAQEIIKAVTAYQRRTPAKAVNEGVEGATVEREKDEALARLTRSMRVRVNEARGEVTQLRTELEAEKTARVDAEKALANVNGLEDSALTRLAEVSERLSDAESRLAVATNFIAEGLQDEADSPVATAVRQAVDNTPDLRRFRYVLERAASVDEVNRIVKDLNDTATAKTGANGTAATSARHTLPSRMIVESERIDHRRQTDARPTSAGPAVAAKAIKVMSQGGQGNKRP